MKLASEQGLADIALVALYHAIAFAALKHAIALAALYNAIALAVLYHAVSIKKRVFTMHWMMWRASPQRMWLATSYDAV